jgi:[ribosomal protein S18]-alanine N-acetyltransferase
MTSEDLEAVMALASRSPGSPHWTRGNYLFLEERPGIALVAEKDHTLSGFAVASLVVDVCELESIVVAEEIRRQGVGAAMLEAIFAWARGRGARRVELEVRAGNTGAIALYQRGGFARDGLRRGYYRDPEEDAVLMGLALDSHP